MSEKNMLIVIHGMLFLLQLIVVGLVVVVDKNFSALSPVIGAAQSFYPNPWKVQP